jgi:hypothetical protein
VTDTYDEATPPDLTAPVSPSAARIVDMEKDLLREDDVLVLANRTSW